MTDPIHEKPDSIPVRTFLKDYQLLPCQVDHIFLDINLDPQRTVVRSRMEISPIGEGLPEGTLRLDGDELEFIQATCNGKTLPPHSTQVDSKGVTVSDLPQGPFTLEIESACCPGSNTGFMGLYFADRLFTTQCEPEGFRRIAYSLDRPDQLSTYRVRIEGERELFPTMLSNGNRAEAGAAEDPGRHYVIWEDPFPKPSYLFALVGGKLDVLEDTFRTRSEKEVLLQIYTVPGEAHRAEFAMTALKRSMRWDEESFGREYDLERFMIVAVPSFNMGAMENKGLNIFNDAYILADSSMSIDGQFEVIDAVIAHEYFHNWTGNRITCRDWFQLCLKEGLTVYRDQEYTADATSRGVKRVHDVATLWQAQFSEDASALAHPVRPESFAEIDNFYTATVYEKGAELVRMLQVILGPDGFRRGMDRYFDTLDGQATTVEAFVDCFVSTSGIDLSHFFRWYQQSGTPVLTIKRSYRSSDRTLTLSASQRTAPTADQANKGPLSIPVRLGLIDVKGREVSPETADPHWRQPDVWWIEDAEASLTLRNVDEGSIPSLLRGYSAPIRLVDDLSSQDHLHLLRYDTDPVRRWLSAYQVRGIILKDWIGAPAIAGTHTLLATYAEGCRSVLSDDHLEPAFQGEILARPSYNALALSLDLPEDPEVIHHALESFRLALSEFLRNELDRIIHSPRPPHEENLWDPGRAGIRARFREAMYLRTARIDQELSQLAWDLFSDADNMTHRQIGFLTLVRDTTEHRADVLKLFETEFSTEPLVMDRWFSAQALIPEESTIGTVTSLLGHSCYDSKNPNRVRALLGAFAHHNPVAFHDGSGHGYELIAQEIVRMDPVNAPVAASLAKSFGRWRAMEPKRQSMIHGVLERLIARSGWSVNVADILTRTLGDRTDSAQ